MFTKFAKFIFILCLAYLSSSCGTEIGRTFESMFDIRDAAIELSKAEEVGVNIHNGSVLSISVVNSYLNDKNTEERNNIAKEIAKNAFNLYESRDSLDLIFVSFTKYERKYFIVEYNNTIESFKFKPSELINLSPNKRMQLDKPLATLTIPQ